jgi:hydroxymethylbilane synthase
MKKVIIASRKSQLAMWQSEYVKAKIIQQYPSIEVDILGLSTKGDEILDRSLSSVGGKGLFTKELEQAILNGEAHLAVHSLKDMPMELPCINEQQFILPAILCRENHQDAFISNKYASLDSLPSNAIVGTSSLRRSSILKQLYPNLEIKLLRGNINTRLAKLDNCEYDAIILASAGLIRLGLVNRIKQYIDVNVMLPSPGQAALCIEAIDTNYISLLGFLNHHNTRLACIAERQVSLLLGGSCQVPLAAFAHWEVDNITAIPTLCLQAWVMDASTIKMPAIKVKHSMQVATEQDAKKLGELVAKQLIIAGAKNYI